MPILYAQPAPPGAIGAAGEAGRAEVMQQNTGLLAEMYMRAAQMRHQQAAAELQMKTASAEGAADRGLRWDLANLDHQLSPRDVFAHDSRMALLQAGAQAESQQINQRARLQAELSELELSQGERLRMQRLTQAKSEIAQALGEGRLTPEEADAALTQLTTGLNPLQMRENQAQLRGIELRNQMMQAEMAQQAQLQQQYGEFRAKGVAGRIGAVPLPHVKAMVEQQLSRQPNWALLPQSIRDKFVHDGVSALGGMLYTMETAPGRTEILDVGGMGGGGAGAGAGRGKAQGAEEPTVNGITFDQWMKYYTAGRQHIDKRITEEQSRTKDGGGQPEITTRDIPRLLADWMKGLPTSPEEFFQQAAQQKPKEPDPLSALFGPQQPQQQAPRGSDAPVPGMGGQAPAPGQAKKPVGPFNPYSARLTPEQKAVVAPIRQLTSQFTTRYETFLDAPQKEQARADLDEAARLLGQYGDVSVMPPEDAERFKLVLIRVQGLEMLAQQREEARRQEQEQRKRKPVTGGLRTVPF